MLTGRVEQFERTLSPIQVLAAATLMEWTGKRAYAARMVKIGPNQTDRIPGLVQRVALETAAGYRARLRAMPEAGIGLSEEANNELLASLAAWTEEIPDSVEDTDPMDASRDPNDPELARAVCKRRIVDAQFATESLDRLIRRTGPVGAGAISAGPGTTGTPPGADAQWHVSVSRQVTGPFTFAQMTERVLAGGLRETTNVLPLGASAWVKLRDVPALLALTRMPPPPDDDALPEPPDDD